MESVLKTGAFFLFTFLGALLIFASEANAARCLCLANTTSKEYQHYSKHFWGTKRQWTCVYNCRVYGKGAIDVVGGHKEWYFGKDDGREGVCDGISFVNRYNNYVGEFIYIPQEPKRFDPLQSSAKNLKTWAEETCR
ncbi:hypothetical protein D3C87_301610 [compost metagenome]